MSQRAHPHDADVRLTPGCGHHCGIRASAEDGGVKIEGHCPCPECRCEQAHGDPVDG